MKQHINKWGGSGPLLHLAHANSFHPGVYKELIEELKKSFEVHSFLFRPFHELAMPDEISNWDPLRDDMIRAFDEMGWKNVIGLGHSLGSTVSMMAAIKRPDLFSNMIIIEQPCVDQILFNILALIPYPIAKRIVPPAKIALKRRHKWPSREKAFDLLRPKKIFAKWSDETMMAYIENGISKDADGEYRLTFSKDWEAKIYCTIQNPYKLFPKLEVPSLCIRAGDSDVINDKNWQKWQDIHQNAQFVNISGTGHLLPMEEPKTLAKVVIDYLEAGGSAH